MILIRNTGKITASYMQELRYNIKQAGIADLNTLLALESHILGMWTRQMVEADLTDTRKEVYLIYPDTGEPAGYIDIWYGFENDCHILSFGVLEKYRNQGLGGSLIDYIVQLAKMRNLSFISLEVRADNADAIHLYKKFGFEELGYRKKYYKDGSDALIMMLEL